MDHDIVDRMKVVHALLVACTRTEAKSPRAARRPVGDDEGGQQHVLTKPHAQAILQIPHLELLRNRMCSQRLGEADRRERLFGVHNLQLARGLRAKQHPQTAAGAIFVKACLRQLAEGKSKPKATASVGNTVGTTGSTDHKVEARNK